MNSRLIGFLGYDGVTALDLVGPLEAFSSACRNSAGYQTTVIGLSARPFVAESGVVFKPACTLRTAPRLDTLVVPGGAGLRDAAVARKILPWIVTRAATTRRIASVCTGIYGLAPAGLLDGLTVTTHWRFAQDVIERFPRLVVDPNAIFVKSGKFYTSAGITAGIDLALALIEEDCGPQIALDTARELVVYLKRPGGQEQFSEPLRFQTASKDAFGDLPAWIAAHLSEDLSVEALADRACVCPRHFSRRFKTAFGSPPAAFVESLRLSEARRRLAESTGSIASIASSVGFSSDDAFRRAFERHFDISPTAYRSRFAFCETAGART